MKAHTIRRETGTLLEFWRAHDHVIPFDEFLARRWAILARRYGISVADAVRDALRKAVQHEV